MEESADNNQRVGEEAQDIEEGWGGDGTEESAGEGEIFEGLVHPLKVVKIKNPLGILQSTSQIPQKRVGFFCFKKNMFWWDSLMYMLQPWFGDNMGLLYSTKIGQRKL